MCFSEQITSNFIVDEGTYSMSKIREFFKFLNLHYIMVKWRIYKR